MSEQNAEIQTRNEILDAADQLVRDFGTSQAEAYFSRFAPDATFCFYTHDRRLDSRAEYEDLWKRWEKEDGFKVLSCRSINPLVQLTGHAAVFSHDVDTVVYTTSDGETSLAERETIVFEHRSDKWVAIHEHLSPR